MTSFLEKHKRHPKLYIDLPSQGKWYNETVAEKFEGLAVFGMSAMDEIILKTPDALFSGEATAQVISSCIPDIKDPWQLVGYDIDYVLIAIRIATYGENIATTSTCPHCKQASESEIALAKLLQRINENDLTFSFTLKDLTFDITPITYAQTTAMSIESYTIERQILEVPNLEIEEKQKDKMANDLYTQAAQLNLRLAVAHIDRISDQDNQETDREKISEFVQENDVEFYTKLRESISTLTEAWQLPAFDVQCPLEECSETYTTKLDMDYSNFFGTKSLRSRNLI